MMIGGLQKHSLIDYPGKVSAVCFLTGCNFACPYCHNPHLVKRDLSRLHPLDERALYRFLEKRKDLLDGVVISGGEPTLEEQLIPLCRNIKSMGYAVKVDTNGSRPGVIEALLGEGLVDYIAMDIKTDPPRYRDYIQREFDPEKLLRSVRLIKAGDLDYEFRTTCVKPLVDRQVIARIAEIIAGARLYALQPFSNALLLRPDFFEGIDAAYGDEEMDDLRSLAEPWVERCTIR